MKISSKIFLVIVLATSCLCGIAKAKTVQYTNPAGEKFPIVAWYKFPDSNQFTPKRFKDLNDAGFTHIHSTLEGKETLYKKAFAAMEGTDIKVILSGVGSYGSFIRRWKDNPRISMWCIGDEPAYGMFDIYASSKLRFEQFDSTNMIYLNLLPSYASPAKLGGTFKNYIEQAINTIDLAFLSYDHYPFYEELVDEYDPNDKTKVISQTWVPRMMPTFYNDFEDAREVCNSKGIPFWPFCMSSGHHSNSNNYTTRRLNPTKWELSLEAYAALAYGAQGLQYFRIAAIDGDEVYPDPPVDRYGNTNVVFDYIKEINLRIQKLAKVFLGNHVSGVWHTANPPQGKQVMENPPYPFTKITGGNTGVIVSKFENGGRNYLMILNKDVNSSQTVKVLRGSQVKRINDEGVIVRDNHSVFTLAPADFILFTWI